MVRRWHRQFARDPHNWGSPMCHKHWGCSQLPNCLREQTGQAVCALWEGEGIQGLGTGGVGKSGEELLLLEGCTVLCGSGGQGVCGRGGLANVVCRWCLKGLQLSLMPNLLSDSRLGQSRPPDIRWLGQNIRFLGYSFSNSFRKLFGTVFENRSEQFSKTVLMRKDVFENCSEKFSKTVRNSFRKLFLCEKMFSKTFRKGFRKLFAIFSKRLFGYSFPKTFRIL